MANQIPEEKRLGNSEKRVHPNPREMNSQINRYDQHEHPYRVRLAYTESSTKIERAFP
jgi:hypothetical protein